MPKKIMITEGLFDAFSKLFYTAKAYGKEDEVGQQFLNDNPDIKKLWVDFSKEMDNNMLKFYNIAKKHNLDTTEIEKTLKRKGIKY